MRCSTLMLGLIAAPGVSAALAQSWVAQSSGTTASLRGVSVGSAQVAWASGAGGTYLRTLDGGATWHSAIVPGAGDLDFRAVRAMNDRTAWLMSAGPGAKSRIYKSTDGGLHWSLLYTNPDAAGFFDALAFWDARRGVLLADPVDGQFVVLTTADGGETWQRHKLPPALP
ncbi:MAG: WD40/YVTN/BNR-like repeat-containing protein, partial [Bryobacteraceae bacterium]